MSRTHRIRSIVDRLENRIAPATLVGANTATYVDVDGDSVVVSFSKPILTSVAIAGIDSTTGSFYNNGAIDGTEFGTILIKGNIVGIPTAASKITTFGAVTPTATTDIALGMLTV
jgi:hypothetical protein